MNVDTTQSISLKNIKNDNVMLKRLNWINKKNFSDEDINLYKKAILFKNKIKLAINEILFNSNKNYLIYSIDQFWIEILELIYSKYLDFAFKLELKKIRTSRYVFSIDNAEWTTLFKKFNPIQKKKLYWYLPTKDFSDIFKDDECCPVCMEEFVCKENYDDPTFYKDRHDCNCDDFIDTLKCGHRIHNNCYFKMYANQSMSRELRCPLCRDCDETHFYNKRRLKTLKKWEMEETLNEMLIEKINRIAFNSSIDTITNMPYTE